MLLSTTTEKRRQEAQDYDDAVKSANLDKENGR